MDLDLGILIFKSFFEVLTILEVDNKNLQFLPIDVMAS